MEELKSKYELLNKGLRQLARIVSKYQRAHQNFTMRLTEETEDEYAIYRDSLIKRFEFCYELLWKYLKVVLKTHYSIESNSPRKVFQDCFSQGIVTEPEVRILLEMIDSRNETTHAYDEPGIDVIGRKIVGYVKVFHTLAERCAQYQ